ncbi:MAG: protein kinase [Xanthobacteraceae bacterium]|nr:protein kinase [Xanthobacteraceae bacterium]
MIGSIHSDARSWDELWEALSTGPSGGQASSKIGRRRNTTVEPGFIKILTQQTQTERRQRFYREAATLESLEIEGVPRLIETNARHYKDRAYQLYAVSTYIPGKTLRELPKASYAPEQAIHWIVSLCEILRLCREAGIRHRDIKPENCIIDGDGKFHLVDFGLSSNVYKQDGFDTPIGKEIGNRFLRVPELRSDSANKDDPRTDLTLAVGVLFFLLTQENPRVLLDEKGRFLHQRLDNTSLCKTINIPRPERLIRLFDQVFQLNLDQRFQSAESLRDALRETLEPAPSGTKADLLQRRILQHTRSAAAMQSQVMMDKLHSMRVQIDGLCDRMLEELGGAVSRLGGPVPHADVRQASLSYETGFLYSRDTRIHIMLGFVMRYVGTEIIVSIYSNRSAQAYIRVPTAIAQLTTDDLEIIRESYLSKLTSALDSAD